MISISGLLGQAFAILLALVLAPLLSGWVGQCRAWLQSRTAPPLLLPYYMLQKLFRKDVVLAHGASSLFRVAPFVVFGCIVGRSTRERQAIRSQPPSDRIGCTTDRVSVFVLAMMGSVGTSAGMAIVLKSGWAVTVPECAAK